MEKGILFDFNGTMFFDGANHKEAWNVFSLKYRHRPISDEELDHMHGQTNKRILEMLLKESLDDAESERLSTAKEALYREVCKSHPETFHLVDGLTDLLNQLKDKQIPMTICSASIKDNIDFFISSFHLDQWFAIENIVYDDGSHTDKVSMFLDGAKKLHLPIEDCLVIEDSLSGIAFAHQCGAGRIIAITLPDKISEYQRLPGVDAIIENYHDFNLSLLETGKRKNP